MELFLFKEEYIEWEKYTSYTGKNMADISYDVNIEFFMAGNIQLPAFFIIYNKLKGIKKWKLY